MVELRDMINHLNRWKEMNYFTKESSHSGKKIYEKREMVKYIFHTSSWSHFSLTNLPSHFYFILFLCENRSERVYSERRFRLSNWDENLSNVLGEKNEKMRDGWYLFCEKWIIINFVLPSHLSLNLFPY